MSGEKEIKVYLHNTESNCNEEVYRTYLDLTDVTLDQFFDMIRSKFDLQHRLIIKWESEGKWLNLLSKEDWLDFVNFTNDTKDEIKLFVKVGNIHERVICDNCEILMFGDRFKCLECDDFDICQNCFHKNPKIHSEHCMLLLRKEEDFRKFLYSIPGVTKRADFRVIDVDLSNLSIKSPVETHDNATQVDSKEDDNKPSSENGIKVEQEENVSGNSGSIKSDDYIFGPLDPSYMENVPNNIKTNLTTLIEMGFKNPEILLRLLVEYNNSIPDVVDQIGCGAVKL